ncbi:MAG TPA: hemolysin family protein [Chlamydiales bacterium]|nr:hemolysin family protein [Chlamydiales bacterium]
MMVLFLALLIVFLFFSAYCSASETALFSLSPLTLKIYQSSKDPKKIAIAKIMKHPRDLLVTILMFNVFFNLLIQNVVSSLFNPFGLWILKVGIPLILTLIFCEVLPKSYAITNNMSVAMHTARFIEAVTRIAAPIQKPLTKATNWISRFLFFFFRKEQEISVNELRHVLSTSEESGILLPKECKLMNGILDLQYSTVKERMRPREEIIFYSIHEPLDTLVHLFVDSEITRIPICDDNLDHLLGILSTKRFFFKQNKIKKPTDLISILKKPTYVPESIQCWSLLLSLREKEESIGIVVDEYDSISGLISQEDLIETVVGEIADKRDIKSHYTRSTEDVIIASGKLELSEFREIFGASLKSQDNIATLGGWLIEQLGDIPRVGTKYANEQFLFYILAADPNRIRRVYVRRLRK